jgi:hypothetical protein
MPISAFIRIAIEMKLSVKLRSPIRVELGANAGHAQPQHLKLGTQVAHLITLITVSLMMRIIRDIRGNIAKEAFRILGKSGEVSAAFLSESGDVPVHEIICDHHPPGR